ncbi:UNVERIFIED_CONTAM: hypothetical protein K2H54_061841 [Gekko kuhli]
MDNLSVEVEVNMSVEEGAAIVPRMVKEEENPDSFKLWSEMDGAKATGILHGGNIGELESPTSLHNIKKEPEDGVQQHWEAQWQEFLGTLQAPHSGWANPQVSEEAEPWEDAKVFLASFEQVATVCRWPRDQWVALLLPALSGEAEQAFSNLSARERGDYGKVAESLQKATVNSAETNNVPPPDLWNLDIKPKQEWEGDEKLLGDEHVRVIQVDTLPQGHSEQMAPGDPLLKRGNPFQYCGEGTSREGPESKEQPEPGKSVDEAIVKGHMGCSFLTSWKG